VPAVAGLIFRLIDARDTDALVEKMVPQSESVEYGGQTYLKGQGSDGWSYFRAGECVVVASQKEEHLRRLIVAGTAGPSRAKWADAWRTAADADGALLVNSLAASDLFNAAVIEEISEDPVGRASIGTLAPLWQASRTLVLAANCAEDLSLSLRIAPTSIGQTQTLRDALWAAVRLAQSNLTFVRKACSDEPWTGGAMALHLIDAVDELFDSVTIGGPDGVVTAWADIRVNAFLDIFARLWPAVVKERAKENSAATAQAEEDESTPSEPVPDLVPTPVEARLPPPRSNQELADKVAGALRKAKLTGFDIEITVRQGIATLDGIVSTPEQRDAARRETAAVEGIARVNNRLTVRHSTPD
jgi:hypothetical protein